MAFQTRNLWMLALGIIGDSPPSSLQPPLPDGIHLRWAFDPVRGFPWFGYFLFRRLAIGNGDPACLSVYWSQNSISAGTNQIGVGTGQLSSDQPLQFTEDFSPANLREIDLAHRGYVRYKAPSGESVRWAEVTIGFRKTLAGQSVARCVDFRKDLPIQVENPLTRQKAIFTVFDKDGQPQRNGEFRPVGGAIGWTTGHKTEIRLPCVARVVELLIASSDQLKPPSIVAVDKNYKKVDGVTLQGPGIQSIKLEGKHIAAVYVDSPNSEAIVFRVCWTCEKDPEDTNAANDTIDVIARFGGIAMVSRKISGAPGSIQKVQVAADAIDEIEVTAGPAALIDICMVPVTQNLRYGWEPLQRFTYPFALPVEHADYPCEGSPAQVPPLKTWRWLE
jgi:hypothetical protein